METGSWLSIHIHQLWVLYGTHNGMWKAINLKCETHTGKTDIGIIDCHLPIRLSKSGRNKQWKYISNGKKGPNGSGFEMLHVRFSTTPCFQWTYTRIRKEERKKSLSDSYVTHSVQLLFTPTTDCVCVGFFCLFPWSLKSKQQNTTQKQSAIAQNKQEMMRRKREKVLFFMWIPIGRKSFICETKKRTQEENKKLNKIVKCVQLPNFRSLLVRYGRLRSAYSARTHMSCSTPSHTISPIERQTLCVFVCASMREYTYITFDLSPYRNAFKQ